MKKNEFRKIIVILLVIIWNITIFCLSSENATSSASTSEKLIKFLITLVNPDILASELDKMVIVFQPIIRKMAHFALYTIGGIIYINFINLYMYHKNTSKYFAFILGMVSAVLDETHQLFVAGRSGEITDVIIDSLGILSGIYIFYLFKKIKNKKKKIMNVEKDNKTKKVLFAATVDIHILSFHIPYLKMFKDKGYEVHVVTNGDAEIPYCDVKHKVTFERNPFKFNNIKAIKDLRNIIEKEKFNIIHCHTPMGSVVTRLASKKSRKSGTRLIYTAHGFHFYKGAPIINWLLYYPVEKWLSKYTDILITINEEDYELAKKKFNVKQIELVHGVGVDNAKFDFELSDEEKENLKAELDVSKQEFIILCIGELNDNKNQIMQIEAIKEICEFSSDIKLLLVGEGERRNYLEQKILEYGLQNNVKLLGYRKDVPKLLKIADLVLSTSLREGLPVNVIEAIQSKVPVIATNCRGNKDIIKDGNNGVLVEINNIGALKEAILKFKNDGHKVQFDFEKFEKKHIENKMSQIYELEK